jgi:hypothetical protein
VNPLYYSAVPQCCCRRLCLCTSTQKLEQGLPCVDWLAPDSNRVTLWSPALPGLPVCSGPPLHAAYQNVGPAPRAARLSGSLQCPIPAAGATATVLQEPRHPTRHRTPLAHESCGYPHRGATPACKAVHTCKPVHASKVCLTYFNAPLIVNVEQSKHSCPDPGASNCIPEA